MREILLGSVVEGLDLGTGPNELGFGTLNPDWSKECSSNAPCPQSHPNHSVFQHHLWHKSTRWLCSGCWNAGFLIFVFFLLGGNLPPSSASLSGRFILIETLVLAALALALTLGALFTSLFLSLMLECCIFVVISTGMCHAQTDKAALPDLKHQHSASVWLDLSKERFFVMQNRQPETLKSDN